MSEHSVAFPFLRPADLEPFIAMLPTATDENSIISASLDWLRTQVGPKK